jgi:hypothetical protein
MLFKRPGADEVEMGSLFGKPGGLNIIKERTEIPGDPTQGDKLPYLFKIWQRFGEDFFDRIHIRKLLSYGKSFAVLNYTQVSCKFIVNFSSK